VNSLNIVRVGPLDIEVRPHILVPGASAFEPAEPFVFARSRNMKTGAASARSAP
jgi:hypothetical protein